MPFLWVDRFVNISRGKSPVSDKRVRASAIPGAGQDNFEWNNREKHPCLVAFRGCVVVGISTLF